VVGVVLTPRESGERCVDRNRRRHGDLAGARDSERHAGGALIHEGFNLDTPLGRQAYEGKKPGWPGVLKAMDRVLRG
jgi:hypothetical protein